VTIDGKTVTGAGNRISGTSAGAIAGVTLDLKAVGTSIVTLNGDSGAIARNVKAFAAAVNALPQRLAALKTGDAGADRTLAQVQDQVARLVAGADPAALAAIGVGAKNGKLTIDEAKLNAAIAAAPDDVARVFANGGTGLADKVGAGIAQQLATGGTVATQAAAVTKERDALAGRKTQLVQASALARQYANGARPPSAFDFLV
jgi:flagellar hook-associated protein 2